MRSLALLGQGSPRSLPRYGVCMLNAEQLGVPC